MRRRRLNHYWFIICIAFAFLQAFSSKADVLEQPSTMVLARPETPGTKTSVSKTEDITTFSVTDTDGSANYIWTKPGQDSRSWLGTISIKIKGTSGLTWESDAPIQWLGSGARLSEARWRKTNNGAALDLKYRKNDAIVRITLTARLQGKALIVDLSCDVPLITSLDVGHWSGWESGRKIDIPYDPFPVYLSSTHGLFLSSFFDWTSSNATRQIGSRLSYDALTDGRRNFLQDRLVLIASPHFEDVLPRAPHGVSRYFDQVAGRPVVHVVTTEPFDQIADRLGTLGRTGLHNCIVVIDNWQRDGYDNGLPAHVPANTKWGGDVALLHIIRVASLIACDVYLHQNYIDYYENYDYFNDADIALNSNGSRVKAWFNRGTGQQSFQLKYEKSVQFAKIESRKIVDAYGSRGAFLDVSSSFYPWHRVDMDKNVPGAGKFSASYEGTERLFSTMQDIYQGPLFGEGHAHFFWTGMVDGVEAEASVGYEGPGKDLPFLVNFDLSRIHPYQVGYGMGFYFRWNRKEAESGTHMEDLPIEVDPSLRELYRTQEIAFGHSPLLTGTQWSDPVLAAQEIGLVGPVAARYAKDTVNHIEYLSADSWVGTDDSLKTNDNKAVKVTYNNGLVVTANYGGDSLRVHNVTIPSPGWIVEGKDIIAFHAIMGNVPVGYAETAEAIFADGTGLAGGGSSSEKSKIERKNQLVDFGPIKTDGMLQLDRSDKEIYLKTFAGPQTITVTLRKSDFSPAASVTCNGSEVHPIDESHYWSIHTVPGSNCSWSRE